MVLLAAELDRGRGLLRDLDNPPDRFPWRGGESSELRRLQSALQVSQDRAQSVQRSRQVERDRLAQRPTLTITHHATSSPTRTPSSDSGREATKEPTLATSTAPRTTKSPVAKPPTTRAPEPAKIRPAAHIEYTGPRCYEPGGKSWRPC